MLINSLSVFHEQLFRTQTELCLIAYTRYHKSKIFYFAASEFIYHVTVTTTIILLL
jgi:hypothetical protein